MFRGKKYKESAKQIDKSMLYDTADAMELVVKTARYSGRTKFRRTTMRRNNIV